MSLYNNTARDVIRILTKHFGFLPDRQSGSHILLKHPDGRRTTVSKHAKKVIHITVMKWILLETEIPEKEFIKYL